MKSSSWAEVVKLETPTPSNRTPSRRSRESSIRTARWVILSGASVAPVRVTDRDHTWKSAIFALRVTVRAKCPDFLSRPHTRTAWRSTIWRHSSRLVRSCSKVSSTEIDLAIRLATTGRSSQARDKATRLVPDAWPNSWTSSDSRAARTSAMVRRPSLSSLSAVTGPTPGIARTGRGAMVSTSVPGATRAIWSL